MFVLPFREKKPQCCSFVAPETVRTGPLVNQKDLSFHGLPLNSKSLLSVWIMKMKRESSRKFQCQSSYQNLQCTSHDFINPYSSENFFKADGVPFFSWNKDKQERVQPVKMRSAFIRKAESK